MNKNTQAFLRYLRKKNNHHHHHPPAKKKKSTKKNHKKPHQTVSLSTNKPHREITVIVKLLPLDFLH